MTTRYTGQCSQGHTVTGTLDDFSGNERFRQDYYDERFYITSCHCGYTIKLRPIEVKTGKRECGAWCTDGTGRKCTCVCEGRNHGSTYSHTGALWYAR